MARIWQNWLMVWCGAVGLFGLVLVGSGWPTASGPVTAVLEVMNGPQTLQFEPHLRFSLGLLGAVTLGWSLTLAVAFRLVPLLDPDHRPRAWQGITAAIVAWYIVDSTLSVATGFWPNAASNTVFVLGFLVPVVLSGVLRPARGNGQRATAREGTVA